ncbi:MAG: hypothetical protein KC912_25465, partial [Proteobacteria bacterium]|nr:hypothetical protein [Pseudomonadota bacterium]
MRSALVFALLAGCGSAGEAHKAVLLSTGEIDSAADSRLLRDLEDGLDEMGFDIVHDPNPLDSVDAATARSRADRVGAAHAVVLAFESSKEREGALPGSHLYTASVTAHVVNAIEQHPTTKPFGLEFVREDTSATAIASSARGTWLSALAPHIADALLYSPQLSTVMDGEGATKALIAVTDLKKYEDLIGSRHDANLEYETYCKEQGERLHSFAEAEGITCYGNPCGQYAMVGVTPNNRPIVQDLSRIPIFKVPPARKGYWAEPPERLTVLEEDGTERDLMRSGNFYGIATARAGGVGTVEAFTSEGSSAVWGFSTQDGGKEQLTLLAPRERNALSEVSPDGSTTFWCLTDGAGCFVQGDGAKTPIPQVWWARWAQAESGLKLIAGQKGGGL